MPLEVSQRIAGWLLGCQTPSSGRVLCPVHCEHGTYADGFAALTFFLLGWNEAGQRSLKVSLKRGLDSEFDSLAQALIFSLLPDSDWSRLRERPLYDGNQLVSKNWALFRALSRELHGKSGQFDALESQLPSGLFPDSPVGQATPTCYHAKICGVLALHCRLTGREVHLPRLRLGLEALLALISPTGYLVPYGRSRNTLFAYGSAYLALRLGASLFGDGRFSWGAARVLERLERFQAHDGHIPACLNGNEWMREDWDVYINNPDYNAYAAACLLMAVRLAPSLPEPVSPSAGLSQLGPLLALRDREEYFSCALTGECAPHGSPFFCDTRYAGLVPLLSDVSGGVRVFHGNYCWDGRDETRRCLVDPELSPWTPYVERASRRFWLQRYDALEVEQSDRRLTVRGRGTPTTAVLRSGWQRWIDSRVWRRPAVQFVHHHMERTLQVTLQVDFEARRLQLSAFAEGCGQELRRAQVEESLCPH